MTTLAQAELLRYSRHLILPDVGVPGQEKLKAARVLLIGAGGLGSPAALYLAAAGVGTLGLVDFDNVDVTNLQRQILHGTRDVGRPKLVSARERIADVNPHVRLETYETALTSKNALDILSGYDIVVDGTDNFATRYLVNDACVLLGKPNVYGSIFRFEGQASVFALPDGPCYRCLFPEPPPPGLVPSCAEGGVLGVLPGLVGTIQATEAIKLIVGVGEPLKGRLLLIDTLGMQFRTVNIRKDPTCPACGTHEIKALIDYEQFCGVRASDAEPRAVGGFVQSTTRPPALQPARRELDRPTRRPRLRVRRPHTAKLLVIDQRLDLARATRRARWVLPDVDRAELHPQRVDEQQPASERLTHTDDHIDRLRRLNRPHQTRQHAQHPAFGATRHKPRWRRFREETAIARSVGQR